MGALDAWTHFLLKNYDRTLARIEDQLKGLSFVVPGRFAHAEAAAEALYAAASCFQLLNRTLLGAHLGEGARLHKPQEEVARCTARRLQNASRTYTVASFALAAIRNLQALVDVLLRQSASETRRLRTIAAIEFSKTLLKLVVFASNGGRPVCTLLLDDAPPVKLKHSSRGFERGRLSGKLTALPSRCFMDVAAERSQISRCLQPCTRIQMMQELLHIAAPLAYGTRASQLLIRSDIADFCATKRRLKERRSALVSVDRRRFHAAGWRLGPPTKHRQISPTLFFVASGQ